MSVIELQNVSYGYSKGTPFAVAALKNVSLKIEKGEITGIIGHTGSGKSTLIQMMNGLLTPDSGKVLVDGKDINSDKKLAFETRFKVGLCFQYPEYQLFEETCAKDIAFGPSNMGLPPEEIKRRVINSARFVGLTDEQLNKSPFDLSGGRKRRCAIAGVIAMEPEVLILDEPAAGLDPAGKEAVLSFMDNYRKLTGAAVIAVSHSMEDTARICDRVVVMSGGEIVRDGSVGEVFSSADYLSSIGLRLPGVTQIMRSLKLSGNDVPTDIYSVSAAADAIEALYKRGKRK